MARKRKRHQEVPIEADLLPVMNIMFLLIPGLLMSMEFAKMAAISVSPPKFSVSADKKIDEEPKKQLNLKVFVMEEGFRVTADDQQEGAEAGKETDSLKPTIALKNPAIPLGDFDSQPSRYDYDALEAAARDYKLRYKDETAVRISAEDNIPMQVLINTMDALTGRSCKIGPTMTKGLTEEPPPEDCYFWQPVVDPGASS